MSEVKASSAIWDHTVLHAIRHRWSVFVACRALQCLPT